MIKFTKIENREIFTRDFRPLEKNNEVKFSAQGMAVIYGPNGTGKTSLIKAIAGEKKAHVEFEYNGNSFNSGETVFHVINDQNSRNIIVGEAKDFLLGDNIRNEFELQEEILKERQRLTSEAISMLKNKHGISSSTSLLIDVVVDGELQNFIKDLANNRSKGGKYSIGSFIATFLKFKKYDAKDEYKKKAEFFYSDYISKDSIIRKIEGIDIGSIPHSVSIGEVEENTDAINILNKFVKDQCVVCDTEHIDRESLISKKTENRKAVLDSLGDEIKSFIESIIDIAPNNDSFGIKTTLLHAIQCGDKGIVRHLIEEFSECKKYINGEISNDFCELFSSSELQRLYEEYEKMLAGKPEITDEDVLYIEEIISNSMDKKLAVERDEADSTCKCNTLKVE